MDWRRTLARRARCGTRRASGAPSREGEILGLGLSRAPRRAAWGAGGETRTQRGREGESMREINEGFK